MYENEMESMEIELKIMQEFAEDESAEERAELLEIRLTKLNSYLARSGRLYVEACRMRDEISVAIMDELGDKITKLSPSILKDYIKGKCSKINYLAEGFKRLNKDLVHQSKGIITTISYEKHQIDLAIRQQNYVG